MSTFPDGLYQFGGVPVGMEVLQPRSVRWVYSSAAAAPYAEYSKKTDLNRLHSSLQAAHDATTAARNDMVFITPENHTVSSSVTWSNYNTHLIGMSVNPMQSHVDIWMADATTFDPMITVSGRGCVFKNLTFRHGSAASVGVGYATDLTCMTISGRYNYFENVYFNTPIFPEQDVATTYKGVQVTGHNNYFRGCKFGNDGLERDQANFNISINGVGNIFEDCIFQMYAAATAPFFIDIDNVTRDMKYTLFKNCLFYAHSSNYAYAPAYAVNTDYGANTTSVIFDARCNFVNVSQISDTNNDAWVWMPVISKDNGADTAKKELIALRNQGV